MTKEELLKLIPKSPRTGMETEDLIAYCDGFEECQRLIINRINRRTKSCDTAPISN